MVNMYFEQNQLGMVFDEFIIQFQFSSLMLRKITSWLPNSRLISQSAYLFSQQLNNNPKKKPVPRYFDALKDHIIQYIRTLYQQQSTYKFFSFKIKRGQFKVQSDEQGSISNLMGKYGMKDGKKESEEADNSGKERQKDKQQRQLPFNTRKLNQLVAFLFAAALFLVYISDAADIRSSSNSQVLVNENQLLNMLSQGNFNDDVIISRESMASSFYMKFPLQTVCLVKEKGRNDKPKICTVTNLPDFLQRLQKLPYPYRVIFNYPVEPIHGESSNSSSFLFNIIFWGAMAYIVYKIGKGSSLASQNQGLDQILNIKKFEPIKPENIKTYFKDVAGMHEAKSQITQFVDFLKNPDKYIEMGAKIPKGALLTGPPGTGKTLLARACAGEAGVPFFYVSGSEFVQKYVGLGANRVRSLFASAAKAAPSIIFIDEIDAIGKKRNSGPFANEEKQNTLNQLLVNMDGFDTKNKIIVMAATNLKDSLDPALLRPGRFDRAIQISLPSFEERVQILKVHLAKVKFSNKFTLDELAKKVSVLTPGFSGAELANICNQAAILAARTSKRSIDLPEFEKATERVMAGLQKRNLFSEQQKECLAYYQCGRAVAAWFTEGADPVIKISIAPYSKSSKGYSHEIKDEMPLKTEKELLNKAMCYLAGRTAENKFKGFITSNGDTDLKKAKRIISFIVMKLGMSSIGRIGYPDTEYMRKPYSDDTQNKINRQIERIHAQCQQRAEQIIEQKASIIQKLKEIIMIKQTLSHNTIKEVLGDRPFSDHENYQKFLNDSKETNVEDKNKTPDAAL